MRKVVELDASARKYLDPVVSIVNQPFDEGRSLRHTIFLSACQDAVNPKLDQLVQSPEGIRRHVESTMEDSLAITDRSTDLFAVLLVDGAVLIEYPEDDSICTVLDGQRGVALHYCQFRLRVTKPCPARSDHDDYRNLEPCFCLNHRPERGC